MTGVNIGVESVYDFVDSRILNNRLGIVKDIFVWLPAPDDARIFLAAAITQNTARIGTKLSTSFNSGAGFDLKQAVYAAVGETVERYCSAFIEEDDIVFGNYERLNKSIKCVKPDNFAFYHDEQYKLSEFPFKRFDDNSNVNWTSMTDLLTGERTYLPAASVYLPYWPSDKEDLIWYPVSTGVSCATSIEEAILKGIYEVIERDSFSILWYNKLSVPEIDITSDDEIFALYKKHFEIQGCKYYLFDMTMDTGVPSVLGVLDDEKGGILIAAATRLSMKDAVIKTLLELSQGRVSWKEDFVEGTSQVFFDDFSDIRDFHSRVMLYTKKDMKKHFDFLLENNRKIKIKDDDIISDDIRTKLVITGNRVLEKGYSIYVKDLTTPDLNDLNFKVVRVVIPGFTEITNDHVIPRIGGDRIYNVPVYLGYRSKKVETFELNKVPHPFP